MIRRRHRSPRPLAAIAVALTAALAAAPLAARAGDPPARRVELRILHTNDLHGQVYPLKVTWARGGEGGAPALAGGLAAVASFVERERARAQADGAGFLLLDAGDCWQGTPEGNLTEGRIVVEWMNLVGYDAMAIGNHEFDAGPANVPRLARLAKFPWLSANLIETGLTAVRPGYAPASLEREVRGLRVAILGLTTDETKTISLPRVTEGYDFLPALGEARRHVPALRARNDVVILLSHCGASVDRAIADAVPGIDVIVGGHTHQAIHPAERRGTTLVAATYSKGTTVGRIRLVYDPAAKKVIESAGEVLDVRVADLPPHAPTERLIAAYATTINAVMDVKLGEAKDDLLRERGFPSSKLGMWVADVMREATGADVALTNKTGIRADIPRGPIRLREIYQVSPFGNTCFTMRLTGKELREALEFALGDTRLGLEVSGIEVRYDAERPRGDRLVAAFVLGEPLDPARSYLVATNNFLAQGGDGHRLTGGRDRRDTGIDIVAVHAADVKRRGDVRLTMPTRVLPADPTIPRGK